MKNYFLLTLSIFLIFVFSCKNTSISTPPEDLCKKCYSGETCIQNECVCLTDSVTVKIGKHCINLNQRGGSQNIGYFATNGTYKADTFAVFIPKRETVKSDNDDYLNCIAAKDAQGQYIEPVLGFSKRIKRENGLDSLYFLWSAQAVIKEQENCHAIFYGNFRDNNTLSGKIIWQAGPPSYSVMDSCSITFKHNQNL